MEQTKLDLAFETLSKFNALSLERKKLIDHLNDFNVGSQFSGNAAVIENSAGKKIFADLHFSPAHYKSGAAVDMRIEYLPINIVDMYNMYVSKIKARIAELEAEIEKIDVKR